MATVDPSEGNNTQLSAHSAFSTSYRRYLADGSVRTTSPPYTRTPSRDCPSCGTCTSTGTPSQHSLPGSSTACPSSSRSTVSVKAHHRVAQACREECASVWSVGCRSPQAIRRCCCVWSTLGSVPAGTSTHARHKLFVFIALPHQALLHLPVFPDRSRFRWTVDFNSLSSLSEGIFTGLGSLEELDLEGNELESLHEDVFSDLGALRSL